MSSPLNLLTGNVISPPQAQINYATVISPAPDSFDDTLYVAMPDWTLNKAFAITQWPACHGSALPQVGDAVLVIYDNRAVLRVASWTSTTPITFASGSHAITWSSSATSATVTISHGLSRTPASVQLTMVTNTGAGVTLNATSAGASTFTVVGFASSSLNTSATFYWLATL